MSDDVARAVGANSSETITIDGVECTLRPLSIRELSEIERECLSTYRRSFLSTYAENMELLGEAGKDLLREKMEEAARWDVADLPHKQVYDASDTPVVPALVAWLQENFKMNLEAMPPAKQTIVVRQMTAMALDSGSMSEAVYEKFVGRAPTKARIGYVNWWTTGTYDGMIALIWMCFKGNPGLSKESVIRQVASNPQLLVHASREIEKITTPSVGNG